MRNSEMSLRSAAGCSSGESSPTGSGLPSLQSKSQGYRSSLQREDRFRRIPRLALRSSANLSGCRSLRRNPVHASHATFGRGARQGLLRSGPAREHCNGKIRGLLAPNPRKRLLFPSEFVGRGDMSRGALLLRCVARSEELNYIPVLGARRRGPRP